MALGAIPAIVPFLKNSLKPFWSNLCIPGPLLTLISNSLIISAPAMPILLQQLPLSTWTRGDTEVGQQLLCEPRAGQVRAEDEDEDEDGSRHCWGAAGAAGGEPGGPTMANKILRKVGRGCTPQNKTHRKVEGDALLPGEGFLQALPSPPDQAPAGSAQRSKADAEPGASDKLDLEGSENNALTTFVFA